MAVLFDLSKLNLPIGVHTITVRARAEGQKESLDSEPILYRVGGAEMVEISGTWYHIRPYPSHVSKTIFEDVAFSSNGENYNKMLVYDNGVDGYPIVYGDTQVFSGLNERGWIDQRYRTITFDGVQTVTKEFYEWFTDSAQNADEYVDVAGAIFRLNDEISIDPSMAISEDVYFITGSSSGVKRWESISIGVYDEFSNVPQELVGKTYIEYVEVNGPHKTVYNSYGYDGVIEGWVSKEYKEITFDVGQRILYDLYNILLELSNTSGSGPN